MSRRFWFVTISVAAHIGIGFGVFATNIWSVERLDRDTRPVAQLALLLPPPPAGGAVQLPKADVIPKPRITTELTQIAKKSDPKRASTTTDTSTEIGPGRDGPVSDLPGTCIQEPCGPVEQPPQPPQPKPVIPEDKPKFVDPNTLRMMRTGGLTEIHPAEMTKQQMHRDGKDAVAGIVQVCVSEAGQVTSTKLLQSTKYPAFDDRLLAGVRTWTYRPYATNGRTVKICGTVTFQYSMH